MSNEHPNSDQEQVPTVNDQSNNGVVVQETTEVVPSVVVESTDTPTDIVLQPTPIDDQTKIVKQDNNEKPEAVNQNYNDSAEQNLESVTNTSMTDDNNNDNLDYDDDRMTESRTTAVSESRDTTVPESIEIDEKLAKYRSEYLQWIETFKKNISDIYSNVDEPKDTSSKDWKTYIEYGLSGFKNSELYFLNPYSFDGKRCRISNIFIFPEDSGGLKMSMDLFSDAFIDFLDKKGGFVSHIERQYGKNSITVTDLLNHFRSENTISTATIIEKRLQAFWRSFEKRDSPLKLFEFYQTLEDDNSLDEIQKYLFLVLPEHFRILFRSLKGSNFVNNSKKFCEVLAHDYENYIKSPPTYVPLRVRSVLSKMKIPRKEYGANFFGYTIPDSKDSENTESKPNNDNNVSAPKAPRSDRRKSDEPPNKGSKPLPIPVRKRPNESNAYNNPPAKRKMASNAGLSNESYDPTNPIGQSNGYRSSNHGSSSNNGSSSTHGASNGYRSSNHGSFSNNGSSSSSTTHGASRGDISATSGMNPDRQKMIKDNTARVMQGLFKSTPSSPGPASRAPEAPAGPSKSLSTYRDSRRDSSDQRAQDYRPDARSVARGGGSAHGSGSNSRRNSHSGSNPNSRKLGSSSQSYNPRDNGGYSDSGRDNHRGGGYGGGRESSSYGGNPRENGGGRGGSSSRGGASRGGSGSRGGGRGGTSSRGGSSRGGGSSSRGGGRGSSRGGRR